MRDNFVIDNRMTIHNEKPTFHRKGNVSCIDHIISNCPTKIKNVTTHKDILSDHNHLTCTYSNKYLDIAIGTQ